MSIDDTTMLTAQIELLEGDVKHWNEKWITEAESHTRTQITLNMAENRISSLEAELVAVRNALDSTRDAHVHQIDISNGLMSDLTSVRDNLTRVQVERDRAIALAEEFRTLGTQAMARNGTAREHIRKLTDMVTILSSRLRDQSGSLMDMTLTLCSEFQTINVAIFDEHFNG